MQVNSHLPNAYSLHFDVHLDIEEFRKIPLEKYEKDFLFIVNGKELNTNRLVADILSPVIRRAHYQDSSLQKFIIKVEDIDTEELKEVPLETYFDEFLKVGIFSKITLDSSHQKYFSYYFYALGNIKEYLRLQPKFFEEITIDNVLEKIKFISEILRIFPMEAQKEEIFRNLIDFASSLQHERSRIEESYEQQAESSNCY